MGLGDSYLTNKVCKGESVTQGIFCKTQQIYRYPIKNSHADIQR